MFLLDIVRYCCLYAVLLFVAFETDAALVDHMSTAGTISLSSHGCSTTSTNDYEMAAQFDWADDGSIRAAVVCSSTNAVHVYKLSSSFVVESYVSIPSQNRLYDLVVLPDGRSAVLSYDYNEVVGDCQVDNYCDTTRDLYMSLVSSDMSLSYTVMVEDRLYPSYGMFGGASIAYGTYSGSDVFAVTRKVRGSSSNSPNPSAICTSSFPGHQWNEMYMYDVNTGALSANQISTTGCFKWQCGHSLAVNRIKQHSQDDSWMHLCHGDYTSSGTGIRAGLAAAYPPALYDVWEAYPNFLPAGDDMSLGELQEWGSGWVTAAVAPRDPCANVGCDGDNLDVTVMFFSSGYTGGGPTTQVWLTDNSAAEFGVHIVPYGTDGDYAVSWVVQSTPYAAVVSSTGSILTSAATISGFGDFYKVSRWRAVADSGSVMYISAGTSDTITFTEIGCDDSIVGCGTTVTYTYSPTVSFPVACPTECGLASSTQEGDVTCTRNDGVVVDVGLCDLSGVETTRTCSATAACASYTPSVSFPVDCPTECGQSAITQDGTLGCTRDSDGVSVAVDYCDYTGLETQRDCAATAVCDTYTATYDTPACPTECGTEASTVTGTLVCTSDATGSVVDNSFCVPYATTVNVDCPATAPCGGCAVAVAPTHGQIDPADGIVLEGDTITYSCDQGYELDGTAVISCTAELTYSASAPVCDASLCTNIVLAANSYTDDGATTTGTGSSLTFYCVEGFHLVGENTLTCQTDGSFDFQVPECDETTENDLCEPIVAPTNGYTDPEDGSGVTGSDLMYYCEDGYILEGVPAQISCDQGDWSDASAASCVAAACPIVEPIDNMVMVPESGEVYTDGNITFACEEALDRFDDVYTFNGSASIVFCVGVNDTAEFDADVSPRCEITSVDGGWSVWSSCSEPCGPGYWMRTCDNPYPTGGGLYCNGSHFEECNYFNCTDEIVYGGWTEWSVCDALCDGGIQTRTCTNPEPSDAAYNCTGDSSRACNEYSCDTESVVGGWSNWTDCSRSCGSLGTRGRTCTNPEPVNSPYCSGESIEACNIVECSIAYATVRVHYAYPNDETEQDVFSFFYVQDLELVAGFPTNWATVTGLVPDPDDWGMGMQVEIMFTDPEESLNEYDAFELAELLIIMSTNSSSALFAEEAVVADLTDTQYTAEVQLGAVDESSEADCVLTIGDLCLDETATIVVFSVLGALVCCCTAFIIYRVKKSEEHQENFSSVAAVGMPMTSIKTTSRASSQFQGMKKHAAASNYPPAQPAGGSKLPPNWIALQDPSSGDTYYENTATGVTQWEHP